LVSRNPRETFLNYRDIDIGTNSNGNIGFALSFSRAVSRDYCKLRLKLILPTSFGMGRAFLLLS